MNILLIPATDWLRHPVPSRHHHVFETLAETDNVHVLQFDLFPENISRETGVFLHSLRAMPSKGLASYYLLNTLTHWKKIMSIIKFEKIDVVVVSNLLPGIPGLLSNQLGSKMVFDLKDMFSDNSAVYYKNALLSHIITGTSEWLLQRLLKGADYVIAVSMFLVNYLKQIGIDKNVLIPNGADLNLFKPNLNPEGVDLIFKENFEGSKIIGLVGTMDRWIDFRTVLTSLRELSNRMDVKLLVVGGKMVTDFFEQAKSKVHRIGLQDKVIFTGIVPHKDVPHYINLMDVCLIPMRPELRLNQARCPDKLFEYFACGKPVVSTRISEVSRLGREAVMMYDDASSLTKTLENILCDVNLKDTMGKAALNIAKDHDWRSIAEKYRKTLEKVIEN